MALTSARKDSKNKEVIAAWVAITVALCNVCAVQAATLSTSSTLCPGEEVQYTCTVTGTTLTWNIRPPNSQYTTTYISNEDIGLVRHPTGTDGQQQFEFNLTLTDPLTSTMTTTLTPALDGTEVDCTGTTLERVIIDQLSPPSPPTSPTSMVAGQTVGTTSATVTVQWGASTGASVSYIVSISPDIPSPVTTSNTSLELQNVPYNIQHTVSVVATNCAGSSPVENGNFTIVGCVIPDLPVNGEWLQFSPSETVGPGTSLSLSCNPGYEPSEVMASTCQSDGSWEPDTAELECVLVDCGPPTLASGVVLEAPVSNTTFNSTFSFRCEEGLFPNTTFEAVCGADDQWRADPANLICIDENAVDCGPPTLASGVVLEAPVSSTTFNSTFSFRCEEGLFPNATFEAVCGADGQWSPDPANHTCIVDCGAPQAPASGSIAPYSSTLEGAVISFQCDQELSPSEEVTATCVRDENGGGIWTPDPAQHSCRNETADCGIPQPPASGSITSQSSTLEGAVISFQCGQGFSPSEEVTATCVRDEDTGRGTWTPDPAQYVCLRQAGNTSQLSTGATVAVAVVVSGVALLLLGLIVGGLVVYCVMSKKAKHATNNGKTDHEDTVEIDKK